MKTLLVKLQFKLASWLYNQGIIASQLLERPDGTSRRVIKILTPEESQELNELTTQKENPLKRPSAHSLIDIFTELKFGRPAAEQKYLDKCIDELKQD